MSNDFFLKRYIDKDSISYYFLEIGEPFKKLQHFEFSKISLPFCQYVGFCSSKVKKLCDVPI
jgi:hypothetical protein